MSVPRPSHPAARPTAVGTVGVLVTSVVAAAAALAVLLAFWALGLPSWRVLSSGAPADASDLLLLMLCAAGGVITLWLGCGFVLAVLGALPGAVGASAAEVAQRLAPAAVRRGATLLVGAVLAATALPAAHAADILPGPPAPTTMSGVAAGPTINDGRRSGTALVPLPDPGFGPTGPHPSPPSTTTTTPAITSPTITSPTITGPHPAPPAPAPPAPAPPAPAPPAPAPPARTSTAPARPAPPAPTSLGPLGQARRVTGDRHTSITVIRGDTLWAIAGRHLGAGASSAEIAREWPRWYAANRTVIGDDPDLILVGQVLTAPTPTSTSTSTSSNGAPR